MLLHHLALLALPVQSESSHGDAILIEVDAPDDVRKLTKMTKNASIIDKNVTYARLGVESLLASTTSKRSTMYGCRIT